MSDQPILPIQLPLVTRCAGAMRSSDLLGGGSEPTIQIQLNTPRAHLGQSLLWWIARSNSEPRSNSPVTGNLLTSFWRARRLCSRIIHKNKSQTANSSNPNFV